MYPGLPLRSVARPRAGFEGGFYAIRDNDSRRISYTSRMTLAFRLIRRLPSQTMKQASGLPR